LALAAWSIFLTNVPQSLLSVQDVLILARARWQIELLFKLWKSVGGIDHSRSSRPWRVLCELFAKMIAVLLQHWLMLYTLWSFPDRSFTKAALALRPCAVLLLVALHKSLADLVEALSGYAKVF
jgi:IS4 transposase